MNMEKITAYLARRPQGATGYMVAEMLGVSPKSAGESLDRMLRRRQVVRTGPSRSRHESVWSLVLRETRDTPPIFRAMETLAVMQEVARERLMNRVGVAYAG